MIYNKNYLDIFLSTLVEKSKPKNTKQLKTQFIYKIYNYSIDMIKIAFDSSDDKDIISVLNKKYYGIGIIHLATFHKDPEVLNYILSLFKKYKIVPELVQKEKAGSGKVEILRGETPMSLAIKNMDIEKIKILVDHNLANLEFPIILNNSRYDMLKAHNLLDLCLYYSSKQSHKKKEYLILAL